MSIVTDLTDCFADTLTAQPGSEDMEGAFVPSGSALLMPAYISGKTRLVRDPAGREIVSSLKVTVAVTPALVDAWIALGWSGWIDEDWINGSDAFPSILTIDGYRFDLPARFDPNSGLKAVAIGRHSDETGAHHETVFFP